MNYTNRPLDIPTAVEYVTNMLYIQRGFFIMTDMGRIAIEGVMERDPVNPVQLYKWKSNVQSEWKYDQHNEVADYYVQIGIHPRASYEYIKMLTIHAIAMVRFYNSVRYHVTQDYIDAAVLSFIYENERDPELYISNMEQEFMSLHYPMHNKTSVELAHYMMTDRINKAKSLLGNARIYSFPHHEDYKFNSDILSLLYDLRMNA